METAPPLEPKTLDDLELIVARLRAPDGCSWDKVQTLGTMRGSLIEELYEFIDALDTGDGAGFAEELGDLYFLLVFYGQLGKEAGWADRGQIIAGVCQKLISRHPHVFDRKPGEAPIDEAEVLRRWEERKKREKAHAPDPSILAGIPKSLPSLQGAMQMLEKTSHVGFIGEGPGVDEPALGDEGALGDALFALVQKARRGGIDPDRALRGAALRYRAQFGKMEALLKKRGQELTGHSADEWRKLAREV